MRNESLMVRFRWHTFASQLACAIRFVPRHLYWFGGRYRLATLMGLIMTLNALFATAPREQAIPPGSQAWNSYYGVVRVFLNNQFAGTGAVFSKRQIGQDFWLCVLTANHVVALEPNGFRYNPAHRVTIAFGNRGGNDPSFDTRLVFTAADSVAANDPHANFFGGDLPDLAVIGVRVSQQIFQQVPAYSLSVAPPGHYREFTIVGYGVTGSRVFENNNFIGYTVIDPGIENTSEIKRFANNAVKQRFRGNSPAGPLFKGAFIEWDLTIGAGAVPGEGVAFPGDSGAPYFASAWNEIEIDGNQIPIRTDAILAVHHGGQDSYRNGDLGWGTELIQGYRQWIEAKCALVPEPGSLLVLLSGSGWVLLLYRRRRVSV
jgi:hypothetical protein